MGKETILILDNERYVQWFLKILLEAEDYTVIPAYTIEEASRSFEEFEISGLITEYRIDRFSTLETVRDLKGRFPRVYVMVLTDDEVDERQYEEIIHAGVDDFFTKPFSSERILLHLKKGLRHHEVLAERCPPPREPDRDDKGTHLKITSRFNEFALKNIKSILAQVK